MATRFLSSQILSRYILTALFALLTPACSDTPTPPPQSNEVTSQLEIESPSVEFPPTTELLSTETAQQATPDSQLFPPPPIGEEEPLQAAIPDIPNVYIVPSRQSKADLATHLRTTPDQLDWVNPRLPDPISPGTLIVIPPIYRAGLGEKLSDIAHKTGLPEELLRATNPELDAQGTLAEGTVLVVPLLYVAPTDTSLSSIANSLNINGETLLSANQNLVNQEDIKAGDVLILPPAVQSGE
ncbi:MAG: LysM peptidoglycan-binding domain-containing protein [Nitrososphaera sp.]|nr:LysM peptidoglycan-binding domain-containing protein [Nitrososphaera sp.]